MKKKSVSMSFLFFAALIGSGAQAMKPAGAMTGPSAMTGPNGGSGAGAMTGPSAMTGPNGPGGAGSNPGAMMMARTGVTLPYTDLASAIALTAKGPVVLFFAADWCPTCQASLRDFETNGARLGNINLVIVDYDKSVDLKRRYGVTVQHTFVSIDNSGKRTGIWNGGGVDGILAKVRRLP